MCFIYNRMTVPIAIITTKMCYTINIKLHLHRIHNQLYQSFAFLDLASTECYNNTATTSNYN